MVGGVDVEQVTVRGDDPRRPEVVAGKAGPAGVVPDPAAEGEPARPDAEAGPDGQEQAAAPDRLEQVAVQRPAADRRGPAGLVDVHRVEQAHVDEQAPGGREAGVAVPAAPGHGPDAVPAGPVNAGHDVVLVGADRHGHRADAVVAAVGWRAGRVVSLVAGDQQPALQLPAQLAQRRPVHRGLVGRPGRRAPSCPAPARPGRPARPPQSRRAGIHADRRCPFRSPRHSDVVRTAPARVAA